MLARAGSPAALGPGHARLLRVDVKPRQRQAAGKPARLVVAPGDNHFEVNETPASPYGSSAARSSAARCWSR